MSRGKNKVGRPRKNAEEKFARRISISLSFAQFDALKSLCGNGESCSAALRAIIARNIPNNTGDLSHEQ